MRNISHALGWLFVIALTGCSGDYARLEPSYPLSPASNSALERSSGIEVVANANTWRGSEAVNRDLLPIELVITNRSQGPIHVGHQDVNLIEPSGIVAARSPRAIRPRVQPITMGLSPIEIDPEAGNAAAPPPPTPEESAEADVREEALREAPIPPGQITRGFVYFPRVSKDVTHVDLRVIARDRPGGRAVAVLVVPFDVVR